MADSEKSGAGRGGDGTNALEKAMDVLDAVGSVPEGLSQSALADRLGLPRTTVYRLLATLTERGYVRRDPLRRVFCLGFRCFEMARQVYTMPDLVAAAALELRALRDLTGETSYLAALDGVEVIGLERCDGAHSQRSQAVLGQRKPVHCTSQGKAILSAMDDAARDALVRDLVLKPLTPHTIVDRRRLNAELRVTATRGYAVDDEEIVLGVRCVGAPIVDGAGQVRGAISVAGPAYRLTPERLQLLGPELAEAGRRIGAQLVHNQPGRGDATVKAVPGNWAFHGAHPLWSDKRQCLYWADILAPSVHRYADGEDRSCAESDQPIAGMVMRDGEPWVAHARSLIPVLPAPPGDDAPAEPLPLPAGLLCLCMDGAGALWAAVESGEGGCSVGPLQEDGRIQPRWRVPEVLQCLRHRADDDCFYATAAGTGAILMLQPGQAAVRRLASVPRGSGRISGLAFDTEGGIWTALCDGWSVVRFTPDGTLDRVVGMPVPCPTDLAVGGADGRRLFVTSARQSVALDTLADAPFSGRLFEIEL